MRLVVAVRMFVYVRSGRKNQFPLNYPPRLCIMMRVNLKFLASRATWVPPPPCYACVSCSGPAVEEAASYSNSAHCRPLRSWPTAQYIRQCIDPSASRRASNVVDVVVPPSLPPLCLRRNVHGRVLENREKVPFSARFSVAKNSTITDRTFPSVVCDIYVIQSVKSGLPHCRSVEIYYYYYYYC